MAGGPADRARSREPRSFIAIDGGDETVAVLWHGLDEAGAGGVVAELAAQGADALGERFVGDRHATPHFVQEAVLGDQAPLFAHQQGQCVEVACVEFDRRAVAAQLAVGGVEHEIVEAEAFQNILRRCS